MKNYIIANLKMYLSKKSEMDYWIDNFLKSIKNITLNNSEIVICPPTIFLPDLISRIPEKKFITYGSQNCFWENQGSFTGEISPSMIFSVGTKYSIVGHSERRNYLKENNEQIALKIQQLLKLNMRPILCIGENYQQKKTDQTIEIIKNQLLGCLKYVNIGKIENMLICYEPIWAISSNGPKQLPTSNEIMGIKLLIKKILAEKYNLKIAEKITIIYGGSVDTKKVNQVCISPEMNGALIGKASTLPSELIKIAQILDSINMSAEESVHRRM